jgi:hypothetical protein
MSVYNNSLGEYAKYIPINPGTNLDMTKFASTMWLDSQHTRWDNGFPRKMQGRELLYYGTDSICRAIYVNIVEDNRRYVLMKDNAIIQIDVSPAGQVIGVLNRTPADWIPPEEGNNYNFSFTEFSVTNSVAGIPKSEVFLFFVPLENAKNPLTNKEKQVYFGLLSATTPFEPYAATIGDNPSPSLIKTSGGIIEQNQVLYIFGEGGLVFLTNPNDFTVIPSANISAGGSLKILAAKPWRGNLLFWSANTLYLGGATNLGYNLTPVTSITIASPTSIIDGRNSTYFWMGLNQMYAYNGALTVFRNDNNRNYWSEQLNKNYLGNCWGIYLESFAELAWFMPVGTNKEASLAIIHNIEENTWYKTVLIRSCGITTGVPPYPVMADNRTLPNTFENTYPIWYEEKGINEVLGDEQKPIEAWVETKMFHIYLENVQANLALLLRRYEKNIDQVGDMWLEVKYYNYPDSQSTSLQPTKFSPETTNINFSIESSMFSFKFISNTLDGFFQFGPLVINYENGNTRPTTSYLGT